MLFLGLATALSNGKLTYSTEDQRRERPNPSKIPFVGNTRNNLASYKSAALWYRRFREGGAWHDDGRPPADHQVAVKAAKRFEPRVGAKTLQDFALNGRHALEAVIASSQYGTVAQAIASLTLFSHPETVRQTGGKAIFPVVRTQSRVGQHGEQEGRTVMFDDNRSPTSAFRWANGLASGRADIQFNHVYPVSLDIDAYTALPNICMTPAFIAKLTDMDDEIRRLLEYRVFKLYGWTPKGMSPPDAPANYEILEWAAPLPAVADVRANLERAMANKPKDRTVMAARALGWLFGDPAAVS